MIAGSAAHHKVPSTFWLAAGQVLVVFQDFSRTLTLVERVKGLTPRVWGLEAANWCLVSNVFPDCCMYCLILDSFIRSKGRTPRESPISCLKRVSHKQSQKDSICTHFGVLTWLRVRQWEKFITSQNAIFLEYGSSLQLFLSLRKGVFPVMTTYRWQSTSCRKGWVTVCRDIPATISLFESEDRQMLTMDYMCPPHIN